MSDIRCPLVIPLDDGGFRMPATRLYVEGGVVFCGDAPGWLTSEVTDTGRRSLPEGWPVLRFAADAAVTWAPLDCEMIVQGGLAALTGHVGDGDAT